MLSAMQQHVSAAWGSRLELPMNGARKRSNIQVSFLSRLFGTEPDPKEAVRPLWYAIIGEARDPKWYRTCGAADTVDGRFDMITTVLALVMLRLEQDDDLLPVTARLTELFAQDMDGQLRETGMGDPTLGKKMGKLMEAMGGRIGAFRTALPKDREQVARVVERNANLVDGAKPEAMADGVIAFKQRLDALTSEQLLAGDLAGDLTGDLGA